jgi:hypothetical protein
MKRLQKKNLLRFFRKKSNVKAVNEEENKKFICSKIEIICKQYL